MLRSPGEGVENTGAASAGREGAGLRAVNHSDWG